MTELTRRRSAGGAAAAGALAFTQLRRAAAPPVGKQAPGFYRYKVGDFECTSITDGARTFPMPDSFVRNVPKEQALAAAEAAYMPKGMVTVPFNPQLINTGAKLVLIDTGNGLGQLEPSKGAVGRTSQISRPPASIPRTIDIVRDVAPPPDHINGICAADGALAFPNAEIKVPARRLGVLDERREHGEGRRNDMMKGYFANTRKVFGRHRRQGDALRMGQGGRARHHRARRRGHTPGHTAFVVASGSARLLVQSDVTNIPELFLRNPDWHVAFDIDPAEGGADPPQVLRHGGGREGAGCRLPLHIPLARATSRRTAAGYRLVPIAWNTVL